MPRVIGPLPRFAEVHVRRALELIAKHKRIGRKQLAGELGVGEGSMRTILNQLKKQDEFVQVDTGDLTVGKIDVATIVRGAAKKIKRGIEQRDEAIKVGAQGATVLVFKRGKLQFPDEFIKMGKKNSETIIKTFKPREGDVIIISTADDVLSAETGARAAARTLVKSC
ncbi:MAG: hypothetical protein AVW05_01210 [Hadesarchaea archaeon DG-33]|nr:MAG: hypothetical protein AVW05_01210 [Hadesarchaea archaeon DG-33]